MQEIRRILHEFIISYDLKKIEPSENINKKIVSGGTGYENDDNLELYSDYLY